MVLLNRGYYRKARSTSFFNKVRLEGVFILLKAMSQATKFWSVVKNDLLTGDARSGLQPNSFSLVIWCFPPTWMDQA